MAVTKNKDAFTQVPGKDGKHVTYCRICEAICGLVATVKDGVVVQMAPDRDNPHSRGRGCIMSKGWCDPMSRVC